MRVDAIPAHATLILGQPLVVSVQVYNTAQVISAYTVRVLGVDPAWVTLDQDQLSLFPDTLGSLVVTITLPKGIPAGTRRLTIQVTEQTPPGDVQSAVVDLAVPDEQGARISLDPLSVTAGSKSTVTVMLENEGNTELNLVLEGLDEEDKISFAFDPPTVELAPGERIASNVTLKARRPFAGRVKPRTYILRAHGTEPPLETFGAFVQRPRVSRGLLGLLGLLAAITVFAAVITVTLSRVVDKSTKDRDLLLQVINGQRGGGAADSGSISGKVVLLTSGAGVSGVTVEGFESTNTSSALTTTASSADGSYTLRGLHAGSYKLRFSGAGFTQLWYPAALEPDNAKEVQVAAGQGVQNVDMRLGGVPGKITGKVSADVPADAAGATVALSLPDTSAPGTSANGTSTSGTNADGTGAAGSDSPLDRTGLARLGAQTTTPTTLPPLVDPGSLRGPSASNPLVTTAAVGGDGTFTLDNIPSPSTYDLTVSKPGFATEVQRVNLAAGEERAGLDIHLRKGDGLISGHVVDANGPVGGVTVTASDGKAISGTVSLTRDDLGAVHPARPADTGDVHGAVHQVRLRHADLVAHAGSRTATHRRRRHAERRLGVGLRTSDAGAHRPTCRWRLRCRHERRAHLAVRVAQRRSRRHVPDQRAARAGHVHDHLQRSRPGIGDAGLRRGRLRATGCGRQCSHAARGREHLGTGDEPEAREWRR